MTKILTERYLIEANQDLPESASAAFGEDGAQHILDALVASYEMSHDYLPVISPISQISISIQDNISKQPIEGQSHYKYGSMKIGINEASSIDDIILELPDVFVHEVAHLAHAQHNFELFEKRREPGRLHFGGAIIEGVAAHTGRSLGAFSVYSIDMFRQPKVIDALARIFAPSDEDEYETYSAFMRGTEGFSNRGYRVGEFVVASVANQAHRDILELMTMSLDEYTEYAQSLI